MANIKISELNELTQEAYDDYLPIVDSSADETKKISVKNLTANGVQLIAVTDTEPTEYETGDKYYNTTDNKIYTATSSGWANPQTPIENIFYIILETQNIYTYDDDNETLVSVGGGAGGGDSTPIGTVEAYAGANAPDGYLLCDGSAVSRTTYSDLYNVIGTTYGSGDGSTTFNLPNIKGKVVVMLDSNDTDFDTLGETGGNKKHHHLTPIGFDPNNFLYGYAGSDGNPAYGSEVVYDIKRNSLTGFTQADNEPARIANTNDSSSLQPYIVLNYIIKATKVTPTQAQVVNTRSDSTEDTYSCDYVNKTFGGVLMKSFDNKTSVNITSNGGYGIVAIFSALYGVVLQLQGSGNTPNTIALYGTADFTTSVSGTTITLNDLHNWDHYIFIGSNQIVNIE